MVVASYFEIKWERYVLPVPLVAPRTPPAVVHLYMDEARGEERVLDVREVEDL